MDYFKRRKRSKLYKQWVKRADLPPDWASPETGQAEDVPLQDHGPEADDIEAGESLKIYLGPDSGVAAHPEVTGDMLAEIDRRQPHPLLLYGLLVVAMLALCVGFILLLVGSC